MKISPARIEATLRKPDVAILLLHGEDAGLVRSRASQALQSATGGHASPFQLVTLLKEEHARLLDEALTVPLDGTRRIVRVQEAGDGLVTALSKLADANTAALVILEAGVLTPRSKLRIAAEKGSGWASIACYPEATSAIAGHIRSLFAKQNLPIAEDATQFLAEELGGDTARRSRELDKLALYVAGTTGITLDDAMACCAAEDEFAPTPAFTAAMSGQLVETDTLLASSHWSGATGPGLLAGFASHLHRLLRMRLLIESGVSSEEAGRSQRPPLYPRQLDSLMQQVRLWSSTDLRQLLSSTAAADAACKRAASRDLAMASRVILDAARIASRRR